MLIFYGSDLFLHFAFMDAAIRPADIALMHSVFNIATTALLLPFTKQLEKLAYLVIKEDKAEKPKYTFVDPLLLSTPSVAIAECGTKTVEMAKLAEDTILKALGLLEKYDEKTALEVRENEDRLDPGQKRELLRSVRDEAQWLIRMVENLLSITRMSDGDARITKELEAAEEVFSSVDGKFRQRFPGVELALAAPEEPLFVPMDAILIEQVLMNLLENSVCHGASTAIRLSADRRGEEAVFTVQDNGSGIPEEVLPNLFSAALRSRASTSDNRRSMGIGLSVCCSIVRAHGGAMSAANGPDGGAAFCFTLPMEKDCSEEDSQ